MRLEYFPIHGRAMMIRMALGYCNVAYEDYRMDHAEFVRKKMGGAFPYG
jgi:hypothetical protein